MVCPKPVEVVETDPLVPKIFATDDLLMPGLTLLNSDFVTHPFDRYSAGAAEAAGMVVAPKEAEVMRVATKSEMRRMDLPIEGNLDG